MNKTRKESLAYYRECYSRGAGVPAAFRSSRGSVVDAIVFFENILRLNEANMKKALSLANERIPDKPRKLRYQPPHPQVPDKH